MNINIKGAASNAYLGIKALLDFIEQESGNYDEVEHFVEELNEIIVKYQPQLAAYCLTEYFNDPDEVLLPRKLTAKNGAKALLMGEFFEEREFECPECNDYIPTDFDDLVSHHCEVCDGKGRVVEKTYVSWTTIKAIYDKIVEHYGKVA